MATPQIRNSGTIGGNIASAVPSADIPPALMCADASIITIGPKGKKSIPIREFFTGVRKTVLEKNGLIKEIEIDIPKSNVGISYQKFALREAAALAVVGVAAMMEIKNNVIKDACIVLGAVAPTSVVARQACKFLKGKEPTPANFGQAGVIACDEGKPISDIRASKEYRCHLIGVLTRRSLAQALNRATDSTD
jgi:carbon-monoxide dehydrogenase medium subunit